MKKISLIICTGLLLVGCSDIRNPKNENIIDGITDEIVIEEVVSLSLIPVPSFINDLKVWGYALSSDLATYIIEPQFEKVTLFRDELAIVDGGLINKEGAIVIPTYTYMSLKYWSGVYIAFNGLQFQILDKEGQPISDFYDSIFEDQGYIVARNGEEYFYFDEESLTFMVIELEAGMYYSDVSKRVLANIKSPFKIITKKNGQYGFSGIDGTFDYIEAFKDGYAVVGYVLDESYSYLVEYDYGVIDTEGQFLFEIKYPYIENLGEGDFLVTDQSMIDEFDRYVIGYSTEAIKKNMYHLDQLLIEGLYIYEKIDENLFFVNDGHMFKLIDDEGNRLYENISFNKYLTFEKIDDTYIGFDDSGIPWIVFNEAFVNHFNTEKVYPNVTISKMFLDGPATRQSYPLLFMNDMTIANKINDALVLERYQVEGNTMYDSSEVDYLAEVKGTIITIEHSGFWYGFGAAHGNYYEETMHFDLETGERLTLNNLLGDESHLLVAKLLADYPYEMPYFYIDMEESSREERIEYFTRDVYNFRVSDQTLEIYFNPYDIGPYAAGIVTFVFDLVDLQNQLLPESTFLK